jgi:hypothetical protein
VSSSEVNRDEREAVRHGDEGLVVQDREDVPWKESVTTNRDSANALSHVCTVGRR